MIRVRFFASLREQLGCEWLEIQSNSAANLSDVVQGIRTRLGEGAASAVSAPNIRVALNREFVAGNAAVHDGDEVAFMPPITGG